MAGGYRGGFRGGGRGSGGSSPRSGRGSASGSKGRASSKGQVKGGKSVQYAIKDSKGNPTYYGTTNNPRQRAAEHKQSGKLGRGDKFEVQTKPTSRRSAERVEAAKLGSHRRQHGSNPKHNNTRDGKFH